MAYQFMSTLGHHSGNSRQNPVYSMLCWDIYTFGLKPFLAFNLQHEDPILSKSTAFTCSYIKFTTSISIASAKVINIL